MKRALGLLAMAGCMEIYVDAELPDLTVEFTAQDSCEPGDQVEVTVTAFDPETGTLMDTPRQTTAGCDAFRVRVLDVPRAWQMVEAVHRRATGELRGFGRALGDTRDGRSGYAFTWLSVDSAFVTHWLAAPDGARCTFDGETYITVLFRSVDTEWPSYADCRAPALHQVPIGDYAFAVVVKDLNERPLARSATLRATLSAPGDHLFFGALPLAPCTTDDCDDPPSPP